MLKLQASTQKGHLVQSPPTGQVSHMAQQDGEGTPNMGDQKINLSRVPILACYIIAFGKVPHILRGSESSFIR